MKNWTQKGGMEVGAVKVGVRHFLRFSFRPNKQMEEIKQSVPN